MARKATRPPILSHLHHSPLIYTFMAWVANNKITPKDASPSSLGVLITVAVATLIVRIVLAYGCLKLYDEPVRKGFTKKLL